jgi:hypothetical protein
MASSPSSLVGDVDDASRLASPFGRGEATAGAHARLQRPPSKNVEVATSARILSVTPFAQSRMGFRRHHDQDHDRRIAFVRAP